MATSLHSVRPAAVAGAFYPGDPHALRTEVESLLASASPAKVRGLRGLIVPHAGYPYSGPVAATAYAALRALSPKPHRVLLLGPTHHVGIRGLALPECDALETPLGEVEVDAEGAELARTFAQVRSSAGVHEREHSLEVQLPFLQLVLGDFTLVPLAVGHASAESVAEVIEPLWDSETLVVVSTDLSHYLPWEEATELDGATARQIVALDEQTLDGEQACGVYPLRGLLLAARRRGLVVEQLDLRNSGDTAGDRKRVVGYGAFAVTTPGGTA